MKGDKRWPNTFTEVEDLGGGKFGASVTVGHRVFFDKADSNKPKKHKLTDERPAKDCVVIQSAKCCVEVYPYYAKYFDVQHEEVRLYEERWVIERWREPPGKWQDVGAWNPIMALEETADCITAMLTYDTDYGPLIVKYIQRDGTALKHEVTFTNTSGSTETFRVVQAWAGIVGDRCNGKHIPVIEDTTRFAFHSADKPQRKFNISENLWSMVFNPDGTKKTDQCLQEPVSVETHAQGMKADFVYAKWILASNESLEIDPATATLNNPTEDGYLYRFLEGGDDCDVLCGSCPAASLGRASGNDFFLYGGSCQNGSYCASYRSYIEWPISALAGGTLSANPVFKYHGAGTSGTTEEINPITEGAPNAASDANLWGYIASGTAYVDPFNQEVGETKEIDLGASAKTDLQAAMTAEQSWFAIGLQSPDNECPCSHGTFYSEIHGEEKSGVNPAPTLYVQYNPGGWSGKIAGVTNPAKIAGVDVANIAKVKGVA